MIEEWRVIAVVLFMAVGSGVVCWWTGNRMYRMGMRHGRQRERICMPVQSDEEQP